MLRPCLPVLLLAAFLSLASACRSTGPEEDPSPGAMAEPPAEEATEARVPPPADEIRARFEEAMAFAARERLAERPFGEIMQAMAETFMGRPYIVGPLDGFGREVVVARLDSFDCFTYVEAILAMAQGVAEGDASFEGYLRRTERLRYREGRVGTYCDRLHYFTDWIATNDRRGVVDDVTAEVGGEPFPKQLTFMTEHRDAYPALATDDAMFECIARVEEGLRQSLVLHYIPQDRIAGAYGRLQPGDIVATATDIDGLDVTHTGFVYRAPDGSTGLLHASTDGGVKVSPDLQAYVQGVRRQVGIIVVRPVDPRS